MHGAIRGLHRWWLWFVIAVACACTKPALAGETSEFSPSQRAYWAFQPVERPAVPEVQQRDRVATPIDAFLLQRLEEKDLTYSAPAGKIQLLRRVKFDLLGLPPTPEEMNEFLADTLPDAYERMVDRFLASPHYGEAWGRKWLDLVRFAETAGFNADPLRPHAYKYRDYAIRAFNEDRPYDRFVQEQIAGDELFPDDPQAIIATGYNRMWPDESNASNVELARQDALNDLTANVGAVFLGMSIGCAQCHDHKFDPILQTDFYRLQAYFAGIVPVDEAPVGSADALREFQASLDAWMAQTDALRSELHAIEQAAMAKAAHIKRLKFPKIVLDAIDTAPAQRSAFQHQLAFWSERQIDVSEKNLLKQLSTEQQQRREDLKAELATLQKAKPKPPTEMAAMATLELPSGAPPTYLLAGGSYDKPVDELAPGAPAIVERVVHKIPELKPKRPGTTGRRSELAAWITAPDNPLTARVMVNRIWQEHFGKALVANANDFGTQTTKPSHPALLDWLAAEFVAGDWSIKRMHRLILNSEAYRQSTLTQHAESEGLDSQAVEGLKRDSDNQLYWHYPRRRLPAESIRDAMLAVAGELNGEMYGAGVKPELPPDFSSRHGWKVSERPQQNRRSTYIFAQRNLPYPLLEVFDLPDMHESCASRPETTVAPQSLMLLNSEMIINYAEQLAEYVHQRLSKNSESERIRMAYRVAFGRDPNQSEIVQAVEFLSRQRNLLAEEQASPEGEAHSAAEVTAFVDFCHALLNANEFVYLD